MPGRYIAAGLYSEVVVNRGSTVYTTTACISSRIQSLAAHIIIHSQITMT